MGKKQSASERAGQAMGAGCVVALFCGTALIVAIVIVSLVKFLGFMVAL